ncbi:hypothetical protein U472_15375 [Orenia metallireducens]|uniref:Uncharacterized protein n=1 Tax=Orenia metallireducens TaxID=1413210 RepID=A0A1C0A6E9_9FIRM|nr:hypothetical protein [Orenia metallireducens]OCL25707.1 hypothetical protein U472_15375 [Orenia metallireducens]
MLGEDEVIKALNSMYERLNDGGILIIDNGLSDKLINDKPKVLPGRINKNQVFYFVLEYPNEEEIVFNILNVQKTKDSFKHSFEIMRLNSMKKKEYEECFSKTKFSKVEYFGDFSFTPFSLEESRRMIAVAEK